ncbi:MAG: hypothetical protein AAFP86_07075 [Planctomycetota bacterium]
MFQWIAMVARWMTPIMPTKAQTLWTMLGQDTRVDAQRWPGVPAAGSWRDLEPGTELGEVEALFPRVEAPVVTESQGRSV